MPLVKYRANFLYAREELFALFACAQAVDVERGGRYDARGGVLHICRIRGARSAAGRKHAGG